MRPLAEIETACNAHGLTVLGGFSPDPDDQGLDGCGSLLMLGPKEGFWELFSASPEYLDHAPHPLDRWSERVLGTLADDLGATKPLFPFGGPPYAPFISWALRTDRVFSSPVGLLVHSEHGLMVSFRGALAFAEDVEVPPNVQSPCESCEGRPCENACPVGALSPETYNTVACRSYLDKPAGDDCRNGGCLVRRACPLDGAKRVEAQSGFHMAAFKGN